MYHTRLHSLLEINAVFRPLKDCSIETDSNRPQNDILSLDGAHINAVMQIYFFP
jgi:hypothetical protein